jgi:hypothetical protein
VTESMRVGRVLRASTRGFDCGTHSRELDARHDFGAFVLAPIANDDATLAVGLVYKVDIKDDQLVAELVLGDYVQESVLMDQRDNRLVPVEVKAIAIGYFTHGEAVHGLPPRPPMTLTDVMACAPAEIVAFNRRLDYFRQVLMTDEVPADALLVAAIRQAAQVHSDPDQRHAFLVRAGRQLARDLAADLKRLNHLLALIHPNRDALPVA